MSYVHGYDPRESIRLQDQAATLVELLHQDTRYAPGSRVLEAGCGVGAQTVTLARQSPGARIVSVDIALESARQARERVRETRTGDVRFLQGDVFRLPFAPGTFDHVFVCFVLEHLARPLDALAALKALLRPGGTVTVIEGDHGSTCFHPDNADARRAVQALVEVQRLGGGDANIGRRLYPLLREAGFEGVSVSPRMVYVDASRPRFVEGFTKNTFTAMVEGVREPALAAGVIDAATFDAGVRALYRTAEDDGVFCYTFFKGFGTKEETGKNTRHSP